MQERKTIKAEDLGGSESKEWSEYVLPDEKPYFDKENHIRRSLAHQPNHKRAVRKKELLNNTTELAS